MPLTARDKLLYARHLLLPEVGHAGQQRLCAAELRVADGADARAAEVATEYVARAGCAVGDAGAAWMDVPTAAEVTRLAGDDSLRECAAAVAGAFAAVEAIKGVLGVGEAGRLDEELTLS